jgi:anhydro-N-acetylmuramic acid kinase
MLAVGLMSGTSLDGIDAALVSLIGEGFKTKIKLHAFKTVEMPTDTRARILQACDPTESSSPLICSLNFELGHLFSQAVTEVCRDAGIDSHCLDFVASHGQTIWHAPVAKQDGLWSQAGTLQIGEPAVIAYDHGVTVVSNFRTMDVAAGGQGAPLVPYSELVLYGDPERNVALLNLGGIGNVTVIPRGSQHDSVFAFDTGPGNMMIDEACRQLFFRSYDKGGEIARCSKPDNALLKKLLSNAYFDRKPPKSTGRELFGKSATTRVLAENANLSPNTIVATLTAFTAKSVADACQRFITPLLIGSLDQLIIGGGGAHNPVLVEEIARYLPGTKVLTQEDLGFSSDAKEAVAFAILGNETLLHQPSNVPSATGAHRPVILGNVTYPPTRFGEIF